MNEAVRDHAARQTLHEEVHSRPPIALWPQERIYSQSLIFTEPAQRKALLEWINRLTAALAAKVRGPS